MGGPANRDGPAVASKTASAPAEKGAKPSGDAKETKPLPTATAALKFVERNTDRQHAFDRSPFDDPGDENPQPGRAAAADGARPPTELASAKREDKRPAGAGVPPRDQPLPSAEETLRQFEVEAAQNQAQIREMEEQKVNELRSMRYQERVKFRDELRGCAARSRPGRPGD